METNYTAYQLQAWGGSELIELILEMQKELKELKK